MKLEKLLKLLSPGEANYLSVMLADKPARDILVKLRAASVSEVVEGFQFQEPEELVTSIFQVRQLSEFISDLLTHGEQHETS